MSRCLIKAKSLATLGGSFSRAVPAGALLALALISACGDRTGGSSPSFRYRVDQRLVTSSPPVLDRTQLYPLDLRLNWTFGSAADLDPWVIADLDAPRHDDRRSSFEVLGAKPSMTRETRLSAGDVDYLELKIGGLRKGVLELSWAGADGRFSRERQLRRRILRSTGNRPATIRLDLVSHPHWVGTVTKIRFSLPAAQDRRLILESIKLLATNGAQGPFPEVLDREWKLELDHDARPGFPCPPGTVVQREVTIPENGALAFAYGVDGAVNQPVVFTIRVDKPNDVSRVVFSQSLDPRRDGTDRWFEEVVEMGSISPGAAVLQLETTCQAELPAGRSLAAFADIRILSREAPSDPPNIILIVLDTLRADRLSCYGHTRETSPFLDRWAEESAVVFENAVAQAPWTLPSHVSLFSGLDALRHGVNSNRPAPRGLSMMAERLQAAGYSTSAITGGGFLGPSFGLDQGFDTFRYWPELSQSGEMEDGSRRALSWFERRRNQRFFLFFHTYQVHGPHRRHEPFFSDFARESNRGFPDVRFISRHHGQRMLQFPGDYYVAIDRATGRENTDLSHDELAVLRTMYDSAIAAADAHLRELFQQLDLLGLRNDIMIVVTSDHGEALGEDGRAGHHYLDEYNIMVPLIMQLPGGLGAGSRIDKQVRLTDVLPTILDVAEVEVDEPVDGVSLVPTISGSGDEPPDAAWIYSASNNLGVAMRLDNRLKYSLNDSAWDCLVGREQLFDLENDPSEDHDLSDSCSRTPALRQRMERAILERHEGFRLTLRNDGGGILHGTIDGAIRSLRRVKSADSRFRGLRWNESAPPTFRLMPGESTTLLFDSIDVGSAEIAGTYSSSRAGAHHTFRKIVDLAALPVSGCGLTLTGNGWRDATELSDVAIGFWLWDAGHLDRRPVQTTSDPEVLEQLRALGYIDE